VNSEQVGLESLAEAGERLCRPTSAGSSFHHCGGRTEKSWDLQSECLPFLSKVGTSRLAEVLSGVLELGRRV